MRSNIDLFDAAKYLVGLHYKADKNYTCSRTKIEKLLAIADLVAIKNGDKLFQDCPIFINNCGIGYGLLSRMPQIFPMDNIITGQKDESNILIPENPTKIPEEILNNPVAIPDVYIVNSLNENITRLLSDVFCSFGAYKAKAIGGTIDEFKESIQSENIDKLNNNHYVDEECVKAVFSGTLNARLNSNAIAKFIFEYTYNNHEC